MPTLRDHADSVRADRGPSEVAAFRLDDLTADRPGDDSDRRLRPADSGPFPSDEAEHRDRRFGGTGGRTLPSGTTGDRTRGDRGTGTAMNPRSSNSDRDGRPDGTADDRDGTACGATGDRSDRDRRTGRRPRPRYPARDRHSRQDGPCGRPGARLLADYGNGRFRRPRGRSERHTGALDDNSTRRADTSDRTMNPGRPGVNGAGSEARTRRRWRPGLGRDERRPRL